MSRLMHGLASALTVARGVFAAERLPEPGPELAPPGRRSMLGLLFSIEPLPRDAPLPPRRRSRWLRWLFALESLDER